MEILIKLNSQTAGRDKLARLVQYLSRFLWHRLQVRGKNNIDRLRSLEYTFSTFRKLLRLGRCLDTLYSVLPIVNHPDLIIRLTVSISKISSSLFLFADHLLWLSRSGLYDVNTDKWSNISNRYWLYSIYMNLLRDFYEIFQIVLREQSRISSRLGNRTIQDVLVSGGKALMCVQSHKDIMIDTVKNCCDVFIPLTALGYIKLSPSTIGFLGVVSSVAGILALIDAKNKLTPA